MTGKQRFLYALKGNQPDHIPLWELEFHLYNKYSQRQIVLGREFEALRSGQQDAALHQNAEVIVAVACQLGFSAVTAPGRYWEEAPGQPAYYWLPGEIHWKQIEILRKVAGEQIAVVRGIPGMICPPGGIGYEEFCYRLYDAPEEIDQEARKRLEAGLDYARRARDAGCDAVFCACDIADNHGVFFSPPHLERFWTPYLHKWASTVAEMGLYTILHSDGNLTGVLDILAASPLHALQAIDPIAGMDIEQVKRQVGHKLCLCGNVDCGTLHFGPIDKIKEQTAHVCQVARPGGRFVLGASNAVFREMPPEHYDAMLATWREHGRY